MYYLSPFSFIQKLKRFRKLLPLFILYAKILHKSPALSRIWMIYCINKHTYENDWNCVLSTFARYPCNISTAPAMHLCTQYTANIHPFHTSFDKEWCSIRVCAYKRICTLCILWYDHSLLYNLVMNTISYSMVYYITWYVIWCVIVSVWYDMVYVTMLFIVI